jgi:hypothetical protein
LGYANKKLYNSVTIEVLKKALFGVWIGGEKEK